MTSTSTFAPRRRSSCATIQIPLGTKDGTRPVSPLPEVFVTETAAQALALSERPNQRYNLFGQDVEAGLDEKLYGADGPRILGKKVVAHDTEKDSTCQELEEGTSPKEVNTAEIITDKPRGVVKEVSSQSSDSSGAEAVEDALRDELRAGQPKLPKLSSERGGDGGSHYSMPNSNEVTKDMHPIDVHKQDGMTHPLENYASNSSEQANSTVAGSSNNDPIRLPSPQILPPDSVTPPSMPKQNAGTLGQVNDAAYSTADVLSRPLVKATPRSPPSIQQVSIESTRKRHDRLYEEAIAKRRLLFNTRHDVTALRGEILLRENHEQELDTAVHQMIAEVVQLIQALTILDIINPTYSERLISLAEKHGKELGISTARSVEIAVAQAQEQRQQQQLKREALQKAGVRRTGIGTRMTSTLGVNEGALRAGSRIPSRIGSAIGSMELLGPTSKKGSEDAPLRQNIAAKRLLLAELEKPAGAGGL